MSGEAKFTRTTAGLRDALFGELEDLKNGVSAPSETIAFAKVAGHVIATFELDLREAEKEDRRRMLALEERKYPETLQLEDHSQEH